MSGVPYQTRGLALAYLGRLGFKLQDRRKLLRDRKDLNHDNVRCTPNAVAVGHHQSERVDWSIAGDETWVWSRAV